MQNPCYTIRKAREEDAVGIGKVHYNGWIDTYSDLLPPEMMASLSEERSIRIFQREGCKNMYVATVNGDVVAFCGYGMWRDAKAEEPPAREGEIVGIYVLTPFQRNGLGKALLEQAERELKQQGFSTVSLWVLEGNTKAQAFYKAMGFQDAAVKKSSGPLCEVKETKVLE